MQCNTLEIAYWVVICAKGNLPYIRTYPINNTKSLNLPLTAINRAIHRTSTPYMRFYSTNDLWCTLYSSDLHRASCTVAVAVVVALLLLARISASTSPCESCLSSVGPISMRQLHLTEGRTERQKGGREKTPSNADKVARMSHSRIDISADSSMHIKLSSRHSSKAAALSLEYLSLSRSTTTGWTITSRTWVGLTYIWGVPPAGGLLV